MKTEITMIPHKDSEKKHSRRFTPEVESDVISDIYFKRPEINDVKQVKLTVEFMK